MIRFLDLDLTGKVLTYRDQEGRKKLHEIAKRVLFVSRLEAIANRLEAIASRCFCLFFFRPLFLSNKI